MICWAFDGLTQDAEYVLGIKLAPVISTSRIQNDNENYDVIESSSSFKLSFGLVVDKMLTENYVLSTGLIYLPKGVNLGTELLNNDPQAGLSTFNDPDEYKLQYLQIPFTLKLFTNEIIPDGRLGFQLGVAPEIKVYEEALEPEDAVIQEFQTFNFPVVIGAGIDYRVGINTVLFGGITYQRGLTNIVKETRLGSEDLEIRSTVISIDAGIKF
jgi:hypothetical protein